MLLEELIVQTSDEAWLLRLGAFLAVEYRLVFVATRWSFTSYLAWSHGRSFALGIAFQAVQTGNFSTRSIYAMLFCC